MGMAPARGHARTSGPEAVLADVGAQARPESGHAAASAASHAVPAPATSTSRPVR